MRMLLNELKSKNCWIFMYLFFVFSELFILNFLLHSSSLRCKGYWCTRQIQRRHVLIILALNQMLIHSFCCYVSFIYTVLTKLWKMTKGFTVVKLHSPGVLQGRKLRVKQIYSVEWHCIIKMSTHFFFLPDFSSLILWSLKVIIHIIFKNTAPPYRKHTEFPLHFPLVIAMQGNNPNCKKINMLQNR